tara:strand:+ start:2589 stop:4067 length:1479 start_codon:yes stop_codon:yes gene_type:complete
MDTKIKWTHDSQILQKWIEENSQHVTPVKTTYHKDVFEKIKECTHKWKENTPIFENIEKCFVQKGREQYYCSKPTQIFVLEKIYESQKDLWNSLIMDVDIDSSTIINKIQTITDDSSSENFHWFHNNLSDVFSKLQNNIHLIHFSNPITEWSCNLWKSYPFMYDFFVPLNVQHSFEKQIQCTQYHSWNWEDIKFTLQIMIPHMNIQSCILNNLTYRITMMTQIGEHFCKTMYFKWYPSSKKKQLGYNEHSPCTCHVWNPYQVNTGATYQNTCNQITIWRSEEACKTFLHEMIHGFKWDPDNPRNIKEWITNHFAVHPDNTIVFFESYVETWATLLNIYMIINYCDIEDELLIEKYITMEQKYIMFQVAKILYNSGFETWNSFFIDGHHPGSILFQQNTGVFSYFIIRSGNMWDLEWFTTNFSQIEYTKNEIEESEWLEHLLTIFRSDSYKETINYFIELIKKNTTGDFKTDETLFTMNTMRMTCIDMFSEQQ